MKLYVLYGIFNSNRVLVLKKYILKSVAGFFVNYPARGSRFARVRPFAHQRFGSDAFGSQPSDAFHVWRCSLYHDTP